MITLDTAYELYCGGQGSGCRGPNCGRKKSGILQIPRMYNGARVIVSDKVPNIPTYPGWIGLWKRKNGKIQIFLERQFVEKAPNSWILDVIGHEYYEANKWQELAKMHKYVGMAHDLTVKEFDKMSRRAYKLLMRRYLNLLKKKTR